VELPDETGDEEYLSALDLVLPRVLDFAPEIVFYLSGVDGLESDVFGRLALTHEGLKARDFRVIGACFANQLPLVITLGGGYSKPIDLIAEAHANTFRVAAEIYGGVKPSGSERPRFSSP
jgi:acetoin utilization deacetylase AcuC-like enzyme